jgi:hypothetical protein
MLIRSEIQRLRDAKDMARHPYAWPGGYPLVLVTADGGCLCYKCIKAEWRIICGESFDNTSCGFRISGVDVNWENNSLYCDHCGERIESAHGEEE